jgi:predicted TIM-barrel fold metal-dependent hydrolase
MRFLPFGRVVPAQEDFRLEMERAVNTLGVKGFKLHPKSDGYAMEDDCVVDALFEAANLDVPVLFHTSFISEVDSLARAVNKTIVKLVEDSGFTGKEDISLLDSQDRLRFRQMTLRVNSLRVIIGHCGWHTSKELFDHLKHPCIYGEISGIKGDVVKRFFDTAYKNHGYEYDNHKVLAPLEADISRRNLEYMFPTPRTLPDYRGWSSKICFGTDFPFLDQNQAIDVFRCLRATDFPGDHKDIANFLALNALKILFPRRRERGEVIAGPSSEFIRDLVRNLDEKGLKKTEVKMSYTPDFSHYPFRAIKHDFHMDASKPGGEESAYWSGNVS